jgi:hypothetical protein
MVDSHNSGDLLHRSSRCFPLEGIDPSLNKPQEIAIILVLIFGLEPIKPSDRAAAVWHSTPAFHLRLVVGHCVIKGELFIRFNVTRDRKTT